jgi:DNA modification methylase
MSAIFALRSSATSLQKDSTGRAKKKAKLETSHGTYRSSDSEHGQRVGFAVWAVVRAWDQLALALGYRSADDMLAPYMMFDRISASYHALEQRARGWAPVIQSTTLLHSLGPQHSDGVLARAVTEPETKDAQLRIACARFLCDVMRCATDGRLFGKTSDWKGTAVADFVCDGGIPACLHHFVATLPTLHRILLASSAALPCEDDEAGTQSQDMDVEPAPDPTGAADKQTAATPPNGANADPAASANEETAAAAQDTAGVSEELERLRDSPPPVNQGAVADPAASGDIRRLADAMQGEPAGDDVLHRFASCYNVCFRDLVETHERKTGTNLTGSVQLVLTDPPYNTRRRSGQSNSSYDCLLSEDMRDAAAAMSALLRPGGHLVVFCALQQFSEWVDCLSSYPDMRADPMPLFLVRSPGTYLQAPDRLTNSLMNMVEVAVHASKNGEGRNGYGMVSYKQFGHVPSRFAGWCNVIDNIERAGRGETLVRSLLQDELREPFRYEQKSEALMKELICRLSQPEDTVVDLFSGTYSTAAACLRIPDGMYRRFVGCELDKTCHEAAMWRVRAAFAREYAKGSFETPVPDVLASMRTALQAFKVQPRLEWRQPEGLPAFCSLPEHLVRFLEALWGVTDLRTRYGQTGVDKWPEELLERYEQLDTSTLLAVDCMTYGLVVRPSTISGAGDGVFATRDMPKGKVVGWYNGSIVYRDLHRSNASRHKTYGPRMLGCTVERFKKYGLRVNLEVRGNPVYLVPPEYCAAAKLNDPRLSAAEPEHGCAPRVANAEFREDDIPQTERLADPNLVEIVLCKDVKASEELFIDYGVNYTHWTS